MRIKEFKDLRTKNIKDLKNLLFQKRADMTKKNAEIMNGKEKNLKLMKNFRLEIAKILTLIREKEILESLEVKKGESK